jgi:toxin ParE1/3/4
MGFKLKIEPLAKLDIQNEINFYNSKQKGLGKKFHTETKVYFKAILKSPFFGIRYDNVHCLPLKKFPAMIHYNVDEIKKIIIVRAVINTHKDPKTYWLK